MKITLTEAAEFLECTESRIQELLREGRLPGLKMGKSWVIPSASFYSAVEALSVSEAAQLVKHDAAAKRNREPQAQAYSIIGRPRSYRSD